MAILQTQGFTLDNSGKRIVVDPITRIEGHLRIEVNVDKDNVIRNAVSTGTMWRGLEVILKGRDPRDAWAFVERICGVCTGVHALASVRSVEDALGIKIPKNANIIRNLMHATLYAQDHLVHFYHLHALDWVDIVSALKRRPEQDVRDPEEHLAVAERVARILPRSAEPPEEVRRERPARHLREGLLGQPGVQAAAGSEPPRDDALPRGARLPEGDREDPDDLRRQEPASELAGRRRAEPDQRRRHGRGGRDQHGQPQHGQGHLRPDDRVRRPGVHPGPAGDRRLLQGLGEDRRRAVGPERDVLRRLPGHPERLLEQEHAAAVRRDPGRRPDEGARRRPEGAGPGAGVGDALLVQVPGRGPGQGSASVRRRDGPRVRAGAGHQGHADEHREHRRERQVLVGEVAALEGQRGRGRPARALPRRVRARQQGDQGPGRRRAEGARRAGHRALLDARPHGRARARVPVGGAQDALLLRPADRQHQGGRPRDGQRREVGAVVVAEGGHAAWRRSRRRAARSRTG